MTGDLRSFPAFNAYLMEYLQGELAQFNRMGGGAISPYYPVAADGLVKGGAGLLYGVFCVTAGTMAAIYDNTSAAGQVMMAPGAMAANAFIGYGGGIGVQLTIGCFADWTSGSFLVLLV